MPQIQSSTELNDNVEASLAHFSDSAERVVVIEGSLGWPGRRESDSQVTCHV